MAKAEPLVIKLIIQGEKKLKPTEARLNKIKDLVNSIDKVSTNLFDGRSVKGGVKALDDLKKSLGEAAAGNRKFAENFSGLNRQLGKFQTIIKESKTETQEFTDAIVAAERVQQKLFSARGAQAQALARSYGKGGLGADLIPNLMNQMDSSEFIKSRDSLSNYRAELTRVFDAVEIGSKNYQDLEAQIRKVDGLLGRLPKANKITGVGSGLAGKEQALKEALRLQNQLETGSDAHIKSIVGTRKAQQAYNQELRVSKTIQSALNLDLIVWKKLLDSVPAIVGKIAGGMKGLFTGQFGKLGQATGVVLASKAIQDLIQKIPFLNQALKDNIQQWALLTQRAVEGITGITVAWTGLTGLLGGAQWVINAVTGFQKFESQAAESIWRTQRAVKNFYESLSAMAWMMQGKGGTPGGVGQLLKDMALGGEERQENKRYEQQGPTAKEMIQKDLDLQITKLRQRNLNEADYIEILQRKLQLERQLRREEKKERVMRVKAGEPFEQVFEKEVSAHKSRVEKKLAAEKRAEAEIEAVRKKREKTINDQLVSKIKAIKQEEKEELAKIKRVMEADAKAHKKALDMEKQRRKARRDRMGRLGENLMLGAGFPMLFGGGAGAVAGGTIGALTQSAMGSGGFGAQILFSALGQQFDAFAKKTATLGQAFTALDKDTTPLLEALGKTGSEFEKQIQTLEKLGQSEKAFALARDEMIRLVGTEGVNSLSEFGENTKELTNSWNRFMTQVGAGLAGLVNAAGILKGLIDGLDNQALLNKAMRNEGGDQKLSDIQSQIDRYSLPADDPMHIRMGTKDFPSLKDLTNQLRERQRILETQEVEKANEEMIQALKVGSVAATVDEIRHLERSLAIGAERADREKEVHEILKEQGLSLLEMTSIERDRVRTQLETRDKLKEQLELWEQIKDTIATGLTNAITGLIEGTKTLKEALAGILKQIAQIILQKAIANAIGAGMGFASGGVAPGGTSLPTDVGSLSTKDAFSGAAYFSSGGMVTRPTVGLIGEAGEDEYIIPASKMAQSMQRYSAGARGEAVIPATGSSYAGGGAGGSTTVNYSGPILNFNSEEFVPKSAVGQIIATATSQGAKAGENRTLATLRNSRSTRSRLGM